MAWYLAPALTALRQEINALWPGRDRSSDGSIGDTSHQARKSDHNPDYAAGGIVRAIDVDKDGIDVWAVIGQVIRDARVAYVIFDGRIWENPAAHKGRGYWRPYTGASPHRGHVHVSVRHGSGWDSDVRSWGLARALGSGTASRGPLPTADLTPVEPIAPKPLPQEDTVKIISAPRMGDVTQRQYAWITDGAGAGAMTDLEAALMQQAYPGQTVDLDSWDTYLWHVAAAWARNGYVRGLSGDQTRSLVEQAVREAVQSAGSSLDLDEQAVAAAAEEGARRALADLTLVPKAG